VPLQHSHTEERVGIDRVDGYSPQLPLPQHFDLIDIEDTLTAIGKQRSGSPPERKAQRGDNWWWQRERAVEPGIYDSNDLALCAVWPSHSESDKGLPEHVD